MSPSLLQNDAPTITNGLKNIHQDGFATRAIHVGSEPDKLTGSVIPAISLSTTYKQDAIGKHKVVNYVQYFSRVLLILYTQGFEYSRSGNPNRDAFEATLASVEAGGAYGLAFASGSSATATVLQSLGPNAHIVSVNDVYGGTFRYMSKVAKINQGLETTFVDLEGADDEAVLSAFRPNTKVSIPPFLSVPRSDI